MKYLLACAAMAAVAANAFASGDYGPSYTMFKAYTKPDIPGARFQAGELGVLQPGMRRVYLYTAWRAIMVGAILSLPVVYLWAYSTTMVGLACGAFLMQVCVQGAWGVIPAHLNELSPADARATFPGTVYQLGNFIASSNAVLQTTIARNEGGNYAFALASVAVAAAVAIFILTAVGREARDAKLS